MTLRCHYLSFPCGIISVLLLLFKFPTGFHPQFAINFRPYGVSLQKSRTSTVILRAWGEVWSTDEKILSSQKVDRGELLASSNSAAGAQTFAVIIISHPADKLNSSNWPLSSHGLLASVNCCVKNGCNEIIWSSFILPIHYENKKTFCSSKSFYSIKRD